MKRISKDITKHCQMACSSGELHAICFLWAHVFYVLILPFFKYTIQLTLHYTLYARLRRFAFSAKNDSMFIVQRT